eukprot:2048932-Alexandrium_andersonii.AAC.1
MPDAAQGRSKSAPRRPISGCKAILRIGLPVEALASGNAQRQAADVRYGIMQFKPALNRFLQFEAAFGSLKQF